MFALSDFIRCVVTARNLDLWSETGQVKTRIRPEEAARRIPQSDPSQASWSRAPWLAESGVKQTAWNLGSLIRITMEPLDVVEPPCNVGNGWLAFAAKPLIF